MSVFNLTSRGSLQGKREEKSYKELVDAPLLKFSGLYERYYDIFFVEFLLT